MEGEMSAKNNAPEREAEDQSRQRSTIAFPYDDLSASMALANAIHEHVGNGDCDDAQLAAWTDQSPKSSGYRTQVYAGRIFGVIESESGRHRLTELGHDLVDPQKTGPAKTAAFLNVPLYSAIYEGHKTGILPPAAALEREIAALGVAEKQKGRARQVFERSADQAGFFEHGKNRLVMPAFKKGDEKPTDAKGDKNGGDGGGSDDLPPDLDPLIKSLVDKLPKPRSEWAMDARKLWLALLEQSFHLVYKEPSKAKSENIGQNTVGPL